MRSERSYHGETAHTGIENPDRPAFAIHRLQSWIVLLVHPVNIKKRPERLERGVIIMWTSGLFLNSQFSFNQSSYVYAILIKNHNSFRLAAVQDVGETILIGHVGDGFLSLFKNGN